jgi:hypothetical protein
MTFSYEKGIVARTGSIFLGPEIKRFLNEELSSNIYLKKSFLSPFAQYSNRQLRGSLTVIIRNFV